MTGTYYGSIVKTANGTVGKCEAVFLQVRLVSGRAVMMCIEANNYVFRSDDAVSWNADAELCWYPTTERCVKFQMVPIGGRLLI